MKHINVVGAVILNDGKVFCAQRGAGKVLAYKWEFPGGKVEDNETPQSALKREVMEELNCQIEVGKKVEDTIYNYYFGTIRLHTFYCKLIAGVPQLTEHISHKWLNPKELLRLEWAPADIPAVEKIIEDFK